MPRRACNALSSCPSFSAAQTNRQPTRATGKSTSRTRTTTAATSMSEEFPRGRISTPPKRPAPISLTPYARGVQQMRTRTGGQTKFLLEESQLPRHWYNIRSDMRTALQPVLHPGTGQPVGPDDPAPPFPMKLIGQEVSAEAEIPIPAATLAIASLWR